MTNLCLGSLGGGLYFLRSRFDTFQHWLVGIVLNLESRDSSLFDYSASYHWGRTNWGVASYGALGHVPPRLPTISFLVYFGVNLTASYPNIV